MIRIQKKNKKIHSLYYYLQNLTSGMSINEFACIKSLGVNVSLPGSMGIDFNDSTAPANFEIVSSFGIK